MNKVLLVVRDYGLVVMRLALPLLVRPVIDDSFIDYCFRLHVAHQIDQLFFAARLSLLFVFLLLLMVLLPRGTSVNRFFSDHVKDALADTYLCLDYLGHCVIAQFVVELVEAP